MKATPSVQLVLFSSKKVDETTGQTFSATGCDADRKSVAGTEGTPMCRRGIDEVSATLEILKRVVHAPTSTPCLLHFTFCHHASSQHDTTRHRV